MMEVNDIPTVLLPRDTFIPESNPLDPQDPLSISDLSISDLETINERIRNLIFSIKHQETDVEEVLSACVDLMIEEKYQEVVKIGTSYVTDVEIAMELLQVNPEIVTSEESEHVFAKHIQLLVRSIAHRKKYAGFYGFYRHIYGEDEDTSLITMFNDLDQYFSAPLYVSSV